MDEKQRRELYAGRVVSELPLSLLQREGERRANMLLERLANLEHEQWAHWTKYMLDNLSADNIKRWQSQIETPYSQLSKKEKEKDREWARKILKIIDKEGDE